MTYIKICGLRSAEHALVAADAGADLLGFVFAPSRRQVDAAQAAAIAGAVRAWQRQTGREVELVGVFVNETPEQIALIAERCDLDTVQLSGDEPADLIGRWPGRRVIKAVRLGDRPGEAPWLAAPGESARLLVDAHVAGSYGGAGVVGDWDAAGRLASQRPILLAGGLGPENVAAAIARVRPWGVDVSSGVETDGAKDSAKIRSFIAAARDADHRQVSR